MKIRITKSEIRFVFYNFAWIVIGLAVGFAIISFLYYLLHISMKDLVKYVVPVLVVIWFISIMIWFSKAFPKMVLSALPPQEKSEKNKKD